MNWLDRLERRFGFIAIPHLILGIIALQAVATLAGLQDPQLPMQLVLDPRAVVSGQWWRLFTYIFVPSLDKLSIIFQVFWFYFMWMMAQALEAQWGQFRLTLYLLSGIFFGAFAAMTGFLFLHLPILQDGTYWTLSLLLAFAALYPDFQIYLFFFLPVKMRWLAWAIGAWLLFRIAVGGFSTFFEIVASLANFILFFGPGTWQNYRNQRSSQAARAMMQSSMREAVAALPAKACKKCGLGVEQADLRLCLCARCGEDGNFWCVEDLKEHLKN